MTTGLYGLLAGFTTPRALELAIDELQAAGYRQIEAFTPFPLDGLSARLDPSPTWTSPIMGAGALAGGIGIFLLMTYANVWAYPFNVGGRPPFSWVAYIPLTFELTVLGSAMAGVGALFGFSRLPEPYHPLFNAPEFRQASTDRFFLCVESSDPQFDRERTRSLLAGLGPVTVHEVPCR